MSVVHTVPDYSHILKDEHTEQTSTIYESHRNPVWGMLLDAIPVLYRAHLCMKCSLAISNFLEEIFSLSHSVVFLYFFVLISEEGFLISPCYSWNSAFKWVYLSFSLLIFTSLLSKLFVSPLQPDILPFCIHFYWGWS